VVWYGVNWYDVWCGMMYGLVCCSDRRRQALLSDKKFSFYSIIFLFNNNLGFHTAIQILSTLV
jgi:hypothetical protein